MEAVETGRMRVVRWNGFATLIVFSIGGSF